MIDWFCFTECSETAIILALGASVPSSNLGTPTMFIKTKEDFTCQKCGTEVLGNGYTNHCPYCLWSKHVDIFPGDRKGECGGMMEPIRIEKSGKEYSIVHKCLKCGIEKINRADKKDNFDMIVQITAGLADQSKV